MIYNEIYYNHLYKSEKESGLLANYVQIHNVIICKLTRY